MPCLAGFRVPTSIPSPSANHRGGLSRTGSSQTVCIAIDSGCMFQGATCARSDPEATGGADADHRRRPPLAGRHRCPAGGPGGRRAEADGAALPRRDRARAAAVARAGRADARGGFLPPPAAAVAGRPAGRSADLHPRRRAAGRRRGLGRLERRQQRRRLAGHARPSGRRRAGDLSQGPSYRDRRHRGAGRRPGGGGRGRLSREWALDLRQRLP